MKTIGLIGGMSWESTQEYYRIINTAVKKKLGGLHSAKILMYSVDFGEIMDAVKQGERHKNKELLIGISKLLETSGADMIVICTNTMHRYADEIQKKINIPLVHIADATAEKIKEKSITKIGLLGTKPTMEEDFYKGRLNEKYGLDVIIPTDLERRIIHDVIFNELCLGEIKQTSRDKFIKIIQNLIARGAQGIILGCTEIPLLIKSKDTTIPLFDTTEIHANATVKYALKK